MRRTGGQLRGTSGRKEILRWGIGRLPRQKGGRDGTVHRYPQYGSAGSSGAEVPASSERVLPYIGKTEG